MQNINVMATFPGGQVGTALVNNNGNITAVIGIINYNVLNVRTSRTSTINSFVPETVTPGLYQLRMVFRPRDGEWKIITRSDIRERIPNAIPFTVTAEGSLTPGGGYGLALSNFTVNNTTVAQNESFNISLSLRNIKSVIFSGGQAGAALVDNNGNIVEVVRTINRTNPLNSGITWITSMNNSRVTAAPPGQYRLRIVVRPTGGEWRIATLTNNDTPTSIDFTVR
jgi:hypothetical protein